MRMKNRCKHKGLPTSERIKRRVSIIGGERVFKTTPKGMQALQMYSRMDELLVRTH
jgi:hypothetical protein